VCAYPGLLKPISQQLQIIEVQYTMLPSQIRPTRRLTSPEIAKIIGGDILRAGRQGPWVCENGQIPCFDLADFWETMEVLIAQALSARATRPPVRTVHNRFDNTSTSVGDWPGTWTPASLRGHLEFLFNNGGHTVALRGVQSANSFVGSFLTRLEAAASCEIDVQAWASPPNSNDDALVPHADIDNLWIQTYGLRFIEVAPSRWSYPYIDVEVVNKNRWSGEAIPATEGRTVYLGSVQHGRCTTRQSASVHLSFEPQYQVLYGTLRQAATEFLPIAEPFMEAEYAGINNRLSRQRLQLPLNELSIDEWRAASSLERATMRALRIPRSEWPDTCIYDSVVSILATAKIPNLGRAVWKVFGFHPDGYPEETSAAGVHFQRGSSQVLGNTPTEQNYSLNTQDLPDLPFSGRNVRTANALVAL
jgi:hypothetical protein